MSSFDRSTATLRAVAATRDARMVCYSKRHDLLLIKRSALAMSHGVAKYDIVKKFIWYAAAAGDIVLRISRPDVSRLRTSALPGSRRARAHRQREELAPTRRLCRDGRAGTAYLLPRARHEGHPANGGSIARATRRHAGDKWPSRVCSRSSSAISKPWYISKAGGAAASAGLSG